MFNTFKANKYCFVLSVRTGLQVPGKESGVAVANGSRYGVGIYLSPDPEYSLG